MVVATLLGGLQPYRGGLLQGEGPALRRAQARALETLFEATEEALGAVSTEDTYLYFVGPAIRVLIIAGTRNTW